MHQVRSSVRRLGAGIVMLGMGAVPALAQEAKPAEPAGASASMDLAESYETRPIDRRFTYVEETLHGAPKGHWEYEQWVTWKTDKDEDSSYDKLSFKHELEYGLAENVHLAIEFADWHWSQNRDGSETIYDASGGELKIRFLDPRTDAVGLGFKTEFGLGREKLEWENRLIVDKIVDRWEFGYNFIVGADWEGEKYFDYDENGGEIVQSIGVSYEMSPSFYLGGEFLYEIRLPDWTHDKDDSIYLGPNLAYHGERWAVALTALALASGEEDEPNFQMRAIFEIDF